MSLKIQGIIGTISRSKEGHYDRIEWKLENFSTLSNEVDHCYHSPSFTYGQCSWLLRVCTNGESRVNSEGHIGLYIMLRDLALEKSLHFILGIKKIEGDAIECLSEFKTFRTTQRGWGISKALSKSALSDRKSELLPSDCLTISVLLSTGDLQTDRNFSDASVQTDAEDKETEHKSYQSGATRGIAKFAEDIGKLFISGENSDIVVQVNDVEFKAHKAILAARTPVFSAMFQHDSLEKESNKLTIKDCEPDIFKEFLFYIYTGAIRDLTIQTAFDLYCVADKYLTNDLKLQCLTSIQGTMSVDTFCATLEFSLKYDESELFQFAMDFAAKNIRSIIQTSEWKRFNQEHPNKAIEILVKSLEPPETSEKD